ncbi:ferredoxin [Candidatus Falkowbacteria bacterium]|jgi:ferredoxin|nr:ferredoxin [Candidatus Falkowbacteria bacterium]MBT7007244.1 ferredoxin [Candidatus Falkowbacteria bacterium]
MKLKIDKEKCIGCGTCPAICADVFEMSDDGKAVVKGGANFDENENAINQAKDACPSQAIEVE